MANETLPLSAVTLRPRGARSQTQLAVAWGQFRKNRLAVFGGVCII
ncbi:MAG: hypothetical protein ACR2J4_02445, partial [Deinococcus sp.]